jgi:exosome complex RNA-binding protein Csl4
MVKTKEMTFIGDILASEEEYLAGQGTFVDAEGNIKASVIGKAIKNDEKKEISVEGKIVFPKKGDFAIAIVNDVKDKVILTSVLDIFDEKQKKKILKKSGIIFIQNLSTSFLENARQAIRIGDVIKTQIIDEDDTAYILTMKEPGCGVILAKCSKCRNSMYIKGKDRNLRDGSLMQCSNCKNLETRRTARDYVFKGDKNEN